MSENLNKIVTNYPVTLTQEEVENLSKTLSAVVTSGSEGNTYDGDGRYIGVDNTNNKISLLSDAVSTLDQVYTNSDNWNNSYSTLTSNSGKWEDVTSAYQTNSGTYLTTANSAEFYPMTGNPSGFMTKMFMATYGQTSYQDIKDAYNAHKIVYCHVPNTTGDRMAFLAFIGTGNSGNFEFQYYRSLTPGKRPSDVFGDELYTYICSANSSRYGWQTGKRYTCNIISAGDGLYSNYTTASDKGYFTLNLSSDYVNAITSVSSKLDTTAAAQTYLTTSTYATDSATFVTSSSNTITGTKQYALTTTGWTEVNGFTGVSADNGLSGNGLTSSPLGLYSSAATTISAAKYEEINTNMLAQKLLVVTSDQQIINYVQGGGANNEGCIFFVTSAHS
jgi:hypothetical protein